MNNQQDLLQKSSFENEYLIRTIGSLGRSPDIALTELVANSWDAGASFVKIIIPDQQSDYLIIEDDGHGMDKEDFIHRWMKLGYNRIQHQGENVKFPFERADWKRKAYGHNGVGRHGLLCFSDEYEVSTIRDGIENSFTITMSSEESPFIIKKATSVKKEGHGTTLKVKVERHMPLVDSMREIISARFLHDPNFVVSVNGLSIELFKLPGHIETKTILISEKIRITAHAIDTTKSGHTKQRQGAAFWVNRRLVGDASWNIGKKTIIDGRTTFGRKYIFIFQSDDLQDYVLPDWSGFLENEIMNNVYEETSKYIREILKEFHSERVNETKLEIYRSNKKKIRDLSILGKIEVENFINHMIELNPTAEFENLSPAITALISLENTRNGKILLDKIINLNLEDLEALNKILENWSLKDALIVLDEIDRRITVIEAIKRLSSDETTNELDTLHPLVTNARWLFGPEFESSEYASNLTLTNAMKKITGKQAASSDFINAKRRADLIILKDSTLSIVGVDSFDSATGLAKIKSILLIELKKGGSTIGREEVNQGTGYIQDLVHGGQIEPGFVINTFVVGHKISAKVSPKMLVDEVHTLIATTYERLVRTAEMRLFRLRERLSDRYSGFQADSLLAQVLNEPEQVEMV